MNLTETEEERARRHEAREFILAHRPAGATERVETSWCVADEGRAQALLDLCRQWQKTKFDHGWAGIAWPAAYGGQGRSVGEAIVFAEEEARLVTPWVEHTLGFGTAGPPLLAHGSEEQRTTLVPRMLAGADTWCQLFSEPEAGSDLFGLRTTATRVDGGWLVQGQKVWTSRAHYASRGILLARSDPDAPKRHGLTLFVLDMASPGVTIRPIRQINGASHFSEVFLDEVLVPDSSVIGEPGHGAAAAVTTLMGERSGAGTAGGAAVTLAELTALARAAGLDRSPVHRQDLARFHTRTSIIRFLTLRLRTALANDEELGPESSVMKLALSDHARASGDLMLALCGAGGMLAGGPGAPDDGRWHEEFLEQIPQRIGGGTDEIQRNTVAERVLGLPRAPRS